MNPASAERGDDDYNRMCEKSAESKEHYERGCREQTELLPGMKVLLRDPDERIWRPACVEEKCDEPRSYIVKTQNGTRLRRNRKNLKEISSEASRKFQFEPNVNIPDMSDEPQIPHDIREEAPKSVENNVQPTTQSTTQPSASRQRKSVRFAENINNTSEPRRSARNKSKPERLIETC